MSCGNLTQDFTFDCANPKTGGTNARIILINKDDFDAATVTRNAYNSRLISNIVLASTKQAFSFECAENTVNHKSEMQSKVVGMYYIHNVSFMLPNNDSTTKDIIKELQQGKFVAIVENEDKGSAGERAFEVLGEKAGLIMTVNTRDNNDDASAGAFTIELASRDTNLEPFEPSNFYDSISYATTKVLVDTLLVPAS